MKNNHIQIEALLAQAMKACGYDSALSETKRYIAAALQSVSVVGKKRQKNIATQKTLKDQKTKYQEWLELLKKTNAANMSLEIPPYDSDVL